MDSRAQYESVKAKVERARAARDRAEWRREELKRQAEEQLSCSNADEARKLLEELKAQAAELDRRAVIMHAAILEAHEELR